MERKGSTGKRVKWAARRVNGPAPTAHSFFGRSLCRTLSYATDAYNTDKEPLSMSRRLRPSVTSIDPPSSSDQLRMGTVRTTAVAAAAPLILDEESSDQYNTMAAVDDIRPAAFVNLIKNSSTSTSALAQQLCTRTYSL